MTTEGFYLLPTGLMSIHTHQNSLVQKTIEGRLTYSEVNFSQLDLESILGCSLPYLGRALLSLSFVYSQEKNHYHARQKIEAKEYFFSWDDNEYEDAPIW